VCLWWAYPDGWTDTSGKGTSPPSETISIENGLMHLHMFILDGTTVGFAATHIPDTPTPMHWVIQSETAVDGDVSDAATADIYIAWVAIYQPA
jgi:hypothetical protein